MKLMKFYIVLCFLIAVQTAWSQDKEPTDEEIGFDRELVRKELYENNPFVNKDFLDGQISKLREDAVIRYKLGVDKWFLKTQVTKGDNRGSFSAQRAIPGCETSTFDASIANPLASNWNLTYNIAPYTYTNPTLVTVNNAAGDSYSYDGQVRYAAATSFVDPYMDDIDDNTNVNGTRYLKIGNALVQNRREMISRTFTLSNVDEFIFYRFAVVLQDPGHSNRPFFSIAMKVNGVVKPCSVVMYEAPQYGAATVPGFEYTTGGVFVRPWGSNFIRPADLEANVGDTITIEVSVSDCGGGGHFGYGYFDMECINDAQVIIASSEQICPGEAVRFMSAVELLEEGYSWSVRNSANTVIAGPFSTPYIDFTPPGLGTYTVSLTVPYFTTSTDTCNMASTFEKTIVVAECPPPPCSDCTSFSPIKNEKYIISGWVKQKTNDNKDIQVRTYEDCYLSIAFYNPSNALIGTEIEVYPTGDVIDGWQRMEGEFTVPSTVEDMHITLNNDSTTRIAYFDDIRVNPVNGSLKSFVYDQESQKLMAELDENNYSTFYEYDKEGGLIRVKKETEKGIYTIQESRTGTQKTDTNGN